MKDRINEIRNAIVEYCKENLNEQYKDMSLDLLAKIEQKDGELLTSSRCDIWVAAILNMVLEDAEMFKRSHPMYITKKAFSEKTGVSSKTIKSKSDALRALFEGEETVVAEAAVTAENTVEVVQAEEVKVEATKETKSEDACIIVAPIEGKAVSLEEVGDGVFSEGILGKGVAIEPSVGRAVSPVNGTVSTVFDTKHAIGLTSDDGAEVLIHIGLDTVKLNGEYFKTHVKAGEKVKAGDLLVEFDIDAIKKAGYPTITPIIITNTDNYEDVDTIKKGDVKEKDKLVSVR